MTKRRREQHGEPTAIGRGTFEGVEKPGRGGVWKKGEFGGGPVQYEKERTKGRVTWVLGGN